MKNPYTILSQKELEVARVRKEILALLTVIPLLVDGPLSWDELRTQFRAPRQSAADHESIGHDPEARMGKTGEQLSIVGFAGIVVMDPITPQDRARANIDKLLTDAGGVSWSEISRRTGVARATCQKVSGL